jgi:hypothetical protein
LTMSPRCLVRESKDSPPVKNILSRSS